MITLLREKIRFVLFYWLSKYRKKWVWATRFNIPCRFLKIPHLIFYKWKEAKFFIWHLLYAVDFLHNLFPSRLYLRYRYFQSHLHEFCSPKLLQPLFDINWWLISPSINVLDRLTFFINIVSKGRCCPMMCWLVIGKKCKYKEDVE